MHVFSLFSDSAFIQSPLAADFGDKYSQVKLKSLSSSVCREDEMSSSLPVLKVIYRWLTKLD